MDKKTSNKVVAIKAWKRADYFNQMFTALEQCEDTENYTVFVSIDGGYPAEQELMKQRINNSSLIKNIDVTIHEKNLGCAGNTRYLLNKAFGTTDTNFVIHLEDDTVPSKDLLLYMAWANKTFQSDPNIFSVSGYNRTLEEDNTSENLHKTFFGIHFSCWGFGLFRRIYEEIANSKHGIFGSLGGGHTFGTDTYNEEWLKDNSISDQGSWARPFNHYYRRDRLEINPSVGRIQNIGETRGKWNLGGQWHKDNQHCAHWYENNPNKTLVYEFKMPAEINKQHTK